MNSRFLQYPIFKIAILKPLFGLKDYPDFASNAPCVFCQNKSAVVVETLCFPMDSCDCLQTNSGETKRLAGRLIFPYINHMSNKKTRHEVRTSRVKTKISVTLFLSPPVFISVFDCFCRHAPKMDGISPEVAPLISVGGLGSLTQLPSRLTRSNHPWIFPGRIPGEIVERQLRDLRTHHFYFEMYWIALKVPKWPGLVNDKDID